MLDLKQVAEEITRRSMNFFLPTPRVRGHVIFGFRASDLMLCCIGFSSR
jgi:hypothetical protein